MRIPSSSCATVSISFILCRSLAECGYPAVYHATCFRISRIAVYSPLYASKSAACLKIVSRTSSLEGLGKSSPVSRYALISLKIHGFPRLALPTITASHPVSSNILAAANASVTSPFPITGMLTASFTCRIMSQSAIPA